MIPKAIESAYSELGINLERVGDRWRVPCPFHEETKASFTVYPDGSFHCFGCRKHGTLQELREEFGLSEDFPLHSIDIENTDMGVGDRLLSDFMSTIEKKLQFSLKNSSLELKEKAYDTFDRAKFSLRAEDKSVVEAALCIKKSFKGIVGDM